MKAPYIFSVSKSFFQHLCPSTFLKTIFSKLPLDCINSHSHNSQDSPLPTRSILSIPLLLKSKFHWSGDLSIVLFRSNSTQVQDKWECARCPQCALQCALHIFHFPSVCLQKQMLKLGIVSIIYLESLASSIPDHRRKLFLGA